MIPQLSIAPPNNFLTLNMDEKKTSFYIYKWNSFNAGLVFSEKITTDQFNFQFFFRNAIGYHWFVSGKQVLKINADGTQIKRYSLQTGTSNIYTDDRHFFFMDSKGSDIYTYNPLTDSMELYMKLPLHPHQAYYEFAVDDENVYLANNASFFIINKKDHSIQDYSSELRALSLKASANFEGTQVIKILLTQDIGIFLITKKAIYRLQRKSPPANYFLEQLKVKDSLKTSFSFRQLTEDAQHNVYASYYVGIAKRQPNANNVFDNFPLIKNKNFNTTASYSLNYWKGYLLWNDMMIDIHTKKCVFINGHSAGNHTTQYLNNDTLWYYTWFTRNLFRYDLKKRHLDSFRMDQSFGGSSGVIEALNAIIADSSGRNLWLATRWDGIALITKEGILLKKYAATALGLKKSSNISINALTLRPEGLWFGCNEGLGLLHTKTGKVDMYRFPQLDDNGFLKNRTIFSMIADEKNNFYLGSDVGLVYFDTKTRSFYYLPENHPLSKIEFNRASAFRSSDGHYYFGSTNGLYSFEASQLQF
jgi:hypothetical protein